MKISNTTSATTAVQRPLIQLHPASALNSLLMVEEVSFVISGQERVLHCHDPSYLVAFKHWPSSEETAYMAAGLYIVLYMLKAGMLQFPLSFLMLSQCIIFDPGGRSAYIFSSYYT